MYRVVLADDLLEFLSWLRSLLNGSRYFRVVGEASSGLEVLPLIERQQPDVIIADVDMPYYDGWDVARDVKEKWPDIRVILISSHTEPVYERLAHAEGVAFIPKQRLSADALYQVLQ